MRMGEKIIYIRNKKGISQGYLANYLMYLLIILWMKILKMNKLPFLIMIYYLIEKDLKKEIYFGFQCV